MTKEKLEISVEPRQESGKGAARRARREGKVPAVVYGGKNNRNVYVDAREWGILSRHDLNLISIKEGKKETMVLVKDVQRNDLKSQIVHIDFLEVNMKREISAHVQLHVPVGCEAAGVGQGGVLEQQLHEIEVKCLPANLPENIEVDISALELDGKIHAGEIALPEGVILVTDPDQVAFQVSMPKVEEEPVVESEGEEAEEASEATEEEAGAEGESAE